MLLKYALVATSHFLLAFSRTILTIDNDSQTSSKSNDRRLINVDVGLSGQLQFSPNQVAASIGDIVQFTFHGRNHSVTQSSLLAPCSTSNGFSTGFNQINPNNEPNITASFTVNSQDPQYFFCSQEQPVRHCLAGMVFALNPGDTMDEFVHNAFVQSTILSELWNNHTTALSYGFLAPFLNSSSLEAPRIITGTTSTSAGTVSTTFTSQSLTPDLGATTSFQTLETAFMTLSIASATESVGNLPVQSAAAAAASILQTGATQTLSALSGTISSSRSIVQATLGPTTPLSANRASLAPLTVTQTADAPDNPLVITGLQTSAVSSTPATSAQWTITPQATTTTSFDLSATSTTTTSTSSSSAISETGTRSFVVRPISTVSAIPSASSTASNVPADPAVAPLVQSPRNASWVVTSSLTSVLGSVLLVLTITFF